MILVNMIPILLHKEPLIEQLHPFFTFLKHISLKVDQRLSQILDQPCTSFEQMALDLWLLVELDIGHVCFQVL